MKKQTLKTLALCGATLCGVLVLLLMLAPGLTMTIFDLTVTNSVYDLLTYEDTPQAGFLCALTFVCFALEALLALSGLNLAKVKVKFEWAIALFVAALFAVSGILFFLTRVLLCLDGSAIIKMGGGAISCGVFSLFGAGASVLYAVNAK